MRNRHRLDEVFLKFWLDRGFDFFDLGQDFSDFEARGEIQQRDSRTGTGRVTDRADLIQVTVRNQP